jgi:hypothetical protein
MAALPFANMTTSAAEGSGIGPLMVARHEIESARLGMLEARTALEIHERLKGVASSCEHMRLTRVFTKTTETYLRLSAGQR